MVVAAKGRAHHEQSATEESAATRKTATERGRACALVIIAQSAAKTSSPTAMNAPHGVRVNSQHPTESAKQSKVASEAEVAILLLGSGDRQAPA